MTGTLDGQGLFALLRRDAHSSNHAPAEIPMAGRIVSVSLDSFLECAAADLLVDAPISRCAVYYLSLLPPPRAEHPQLVVVTSR